MTGTGTVTGTPDQLVLSMGVQTSASSVSIALRQANEAASRVIRSLKAGGVRAADIQTSGLSIEPNYSKRQPGPCRLRRKRATHGHTAGPRQGRQPDPGGCHRRRQCHDRERRLAEPRRHRPAAGQGPRRRCPRRAGQGQPVRARPGQVAWPGNQRVRPEPGVPIPRVQRCRREPRLRAHRSLSRQAPSRSASRSP